MTSEPRSLSSLLIAVSLLGLGLHRLFLLGTLEIGPDRSYLVGHWQHLALGDLATDLSGSLLNLQSQPPFWNGLIGVAAKACSADLKCTTNLIHAGYFLATLILFVLILKIAGRFIKHPLTVIAVSMGFCLSPSVVYYENYAFYPHLTALCFAGFALALLRWIEARRLGSLVVLGLMLVVLSWTWTLFHPLFVFLVLSAILLIARPHSVAAFSVALVTLMMAILPSFKNHLVFGNFAAGNWLGLNLAQVSPVPVEGCSFGDFLVESDLAGVHLGTAFNDPRMTRFSELCKDKAMVGIRAEPASYTLGRVRQLMSSLSMRPHDYIFDPVNWDRYPLLLSEWQIRDESDQLRPRVVATRLMVLGFNLSLIGFLVFRAFRSPDKEERSFLLVILLFILLFMGLAHAVNGAEQERMRYTLYPILWIYAWLMIGALFRLLRRRFSQ